MFVVVKWTDQYFIVILVSRFIVKQIYNEPSGWGYMKKLASVPHFVWIYMQELFCTTLRFIFMYNQR